MENIFIFTNNSLKKFLFPLLLLIVSCEWQTAVSEQNSWLLVDYPLSKNDVDKEDSVSDSFLTEIGKLDRVLSAENIDYNFVYLQFNLLITLLADSYGEYLCYLLNSYVERFPQDPFNSFYMSVCGDIYRKKNATLMALFYYQRLVNHHKDMLINGKSLHYQAIKLIIDRIDSPQKKIEYINRLFVLFEPQLAAESESSRFNKTALYLQLAGLYEETADWTQALISYNNVLKNPNTKIIANERLEEIKDIIGLYGIRNPGWMFDDLENLLESIRYAIADKDAGLLNNYRSRVNFFIKSWEQDGTIIPYDGDISSFYRNIGFFMSRGVRVAALADMDANDHDAYIESSNWSYRISNWYLYFKRVHFPSEPSIHNRWEWKGIYLGEKPFLKTIPE